MAKTPDKTFILTLQNKRFDYEAANIDAFHRTLKIFDLFWAEASDWPFEEMNIVDNETPPGLRFAEATPGWVVSEEQYSELWAAGYGFVEIYYSDGTYARKEVE